MLTADIFGGASKSTGGKEALPYISSMNCMEILFDWLKCQILVDVSANVQVFVLGWTMGIKLSYCLWTCFLVVLFWIVILIMMNEKVVLRYDTLFTGYCIICMWEIYLFLYFDVVQMWMINWTAGNFWMIFYGDWLRSSLLKIQCDFFRWHNLLCEMGHYKRLDVTIKCSIEWAEIVVLALGEWGGAA